MKNGYVLRIDLDFIKPPIWRRMEVPPNMTLGQLHFALQLAMGWENAHMHLFQVEGQDYGDKELDDFDERVNEDWIMLKRVLRDDVRKFHYLYDFGDDWSHTIKVEGESKSKVHQIRVLKGKRACPPEDCGGHWGYEHLLDVLADPHHKEHASMKEWLGGEFDPEAFDLDAINERLLRWQLTGP